MSGYTPLFETMLEGTLYGRWPHTGVWACLLSMVDQAGEINKNPQLIANAIGVPIAQLMECLRDFMAPDPGSQSQEKEGRRLELLDPSRDWGWRVINSKKYREKARLMGKAKRESESGQNASRLRERRRTPKNAAKRPSDSDSDIDIYTDLNKDLRGDARGEPRAARSAATRFPKDFVLTDDRQAYAVAQAIDPAATFENFRDYWTAASGANARKHDWDATWRMWCRNQSERKVRANTPRKTRFQEIQEMRNANQE
jgi:hypothetical protein